MDIMHTVYMSSLSQYFFYYCYFVTVLVCQVKKNKNKVSEANSHCQSVTFTTSGVTNSECLMPRVKDGGLGRCK